MRAELKAGDALETHDSVCAPADDVVRVEDGKPEVSLTFFLEILEGVLNKPMIPFSSILLRRSMFFDKESCV